MIDCFLKQWGGISHGNAQTGCLNHGQVVIPIATGNYLVQSQTKVLAEDFNGLAFGDLVVNEFQKIRLRGGGIS